MEKHLQALRTPSRKARAQREALGAPARKILTPRPFPEPSHDLPSQQVPRSHDQHPVGGARKQKNRNKAAMVGQDPLPTIKVLGFSSGSAWHSTTHLLCILGLTESNGNPAKNNRSLWDSFDGNGMGKIRSTRLRSPHFQNMSDNGCKCMQSTLTACQNDSLHSKMERCSCLSSCLFKTERLPVMSIHFKTNK